MIEELVDFFLSERFIVHGARGLEGYKSPPSIKNDGYGDGLPRVPDVVGVDREKQRVIFGIVKDDRSSLDSEDALTEYNVFLDHKSHMGEQASLLYVLLPPGLLQEFTQMITHYIHREYWHRIVPVLSKHTM
jgi:hypothetical protein